MSNRNDFVIAKTLLNPMVTLDDPRRMAYYTNEYSNADIGGSVGDNNTWNIRRSVSCWRRLSSGDLFPARRRVIIMRV